MSKAQPNNVGESRAYWTHNVDSFPSPVAQFRMAQLIDLDDRLYETARIVYRFLVGWYHDEHGDALLSQRHVAKVMKQRAPESAIVPSRNAVQRAIIALMDTGWVVRTFQGRGKGKGASRYVPVLNVLELAAQGKLPQPAHATGPVDEQDEPAHTNGPLVARANGPVDAQPAQATGPKTLLPDPLKDARTGNSNKVSAAGAPRPIGPVGAIGAATAGFERAWLAYGKYGDKPASKAAWAAIADPDVDHIAERAAAWAASAKPGKRRMPFEKWLTEERYDEADRRAAPARAKRAVPPVASTSVVTTPKPSLERPARLAEVVASEVAGTPDGNEARFTFRFAGGELRSHAITLEAESAAKQELGQREFSELCTACGVLRPDDTDDLHLIPLMVGFKRDGSAFYAQAQRATAAAA